MFCHLTISWMKREKADGYMQRKRKVTHILKGWLCLSWFICWSWLMCVELLSAVASTMAVVELQYVKTCIQSNSQYHVTKYLYILYVFIKNLIKSTKKQMSPWHKPWKYDNSLPSKPFYNDMGIGRPSAWCIHLSIFLFSLIATVRLLSDLRYDCFWVLSSISGFMCHSLFSSFSLC